MPLSESQQAHHVTVSNERALKIEDRAATVLFGLGPSTGHGVGERRMESVMLSLGLRAIRWGRQVHGNSLKVVSNDSGRPRCVGELDGLLTSNVGVGLSVWTADCVPVVLVGSRAVAAVHAGWRGCAARIATAAVERLAADFETPPHDLRVYLGPAVSNRHYQVGREVIDALAATGVDPATWLEGDRVDLRSFLATQLTGCGVGKVTRVGPCTYTDPRLASYRRDGEKAGRQWSLVCLRNR